MRKLTTDEFISKARKAHGNDRYNYDNVEYVNQKTLISIKCNVCGYQFTQTPYAHLKGQGCPKCGRKTTADKLRLGKDEFIRKANEIHDNQYNYDNIDYITNNVPVSIICPIHGEFSQLPLNHLQGQGCPKCNPYRNTKYTNEEFINKIKEIFKNELDYTKPIEYNGVDKDVTLYCSKHGAFTKTASLVLQGYGCPKCF